MAATTKNTKKANSQKNVNEEAKNKPVKVSKTWLAFLEIAKNPGEILDMKAVLK